MKVKRFCRQNYSNEAGQLSFDMIFAIVALTVFVTFFLNFTQQVSLSNAKLETRNQLHAVGNGLAELLETMPEEGKFELVGYKVPAILINEKKPTACSVTFNNNVLTLNAQATLAEGTVNESVQFTLENPRTKNLPNVSANCGGNLTITVT